MLFGCCVRIGRIFFNWFLLKDIKKSSSHQETPQGTHKWTGSDGTTTAGTADESPVEIACDRTENGAQDGNPMFSKNDGTLHIGRN